MADTAIFDVDGTLVDTNYQHAMAWYRAFRRVDVTVPIWRIHRAIGMGGDHLVAAVTDESTEQRHGDELRQAWGEEFDPMLDEVRAFAGVRDLLTEVRRRGFHIVLASSGQAEHVDHYLDQTGRGFATQRRRAARASRHRGALRPRDEGTASPGTHGRDAATLAEPPNLRGDFNAKPRFGQACREHMRLTQSKAQGSLSNRTG
jgi:beta-phosphoglucomutase-like phosphatase (HAD superfamily)